MGVAFGTSKGLGTMGGENEAKVDSECTILECDFFIEDQPITQAGQFVVDGLP